MMDYHRCLVCGVIFDEPQIVKVRDWHGEVRAYEEHYDGVCPICGSEEYEELSDPDEDV